MVGLLFLIASYWGGRIQGGARATAIHLATLQSFEKLELSNQLSEDVIRKNSAVLEEALLNSPDWKIEWLIATDQSFAAFYDVLIEHHRNLIADRKRLTAGHH